MNLSAVSPPSRAVLVQPLGDRADFLEAGGGVDVDLDHAGIGRDLQHIDARIGRRGIAFDPHRLAHLLGDLLDRGDQFEEILHRLDRRDEDRQVMTARLDRHGGAHGLGADLLLDPLLRVALRPGDAFRALFGGCETFGWRRGLAHVAAARGGWRR